MCGAQAGSCGMLLNGLSVAMARSERGRDRPASHGAAGRGGVRDGGQERVSVGVIYYIYCLLELNMGVIYWNSYAAGEQATPPPGALSCKRARLSVAKEPCYNQKSSFIRSKRVLLYPNETCHH